MKNLTFFILLFIALFSLTQPTNAMEKDPYLYILGVVQDAGYPQSGCFKKHCMPGWKDPNKRRGATSIALIDPVLNKKYMFEATPHFPEQLFQLEQEAASPRYTLDGVFLTHAHIGHYAGLMFLGHEAMGSSNISVFAMPRMMKFLSENGPWEQLIRFKNIALKPLLHNKTEILGSIKVTPFLVPHRDEYSETVGYRIEGPNKSALFIPDINKWSQWKSDLAEQVRTVDYALIDATFYADGELPGRDMSKILHPFVTESIEAVKMLSKKEREKVWFIHMNHTNPLLNANSKEHKQVRAAGYNIAIEGIRLSL